MAERTLKEYATPSTEEPQAIIVYPTVEDDNFEIKPTLLNLVQQNHFSRSRHTVLYALIEDMA